MRPAARTVTLASAGVGHAGQSGATHTSFVEDTLVAAAVTFFRRSELVPVKTHWCDAETSSPNAMTERMVPPASSPTDWSVETQPARNLNSALSAPPLCGTTEPLEFCSPQLQVSSR